jgi:hypothetical protein
MEEVAQNNSLYNEILSTIATRTAWENRQTLFYEMRHNGLRRKKLPFAGAADLHYPLADSMIEKHKPFYYQILFSQDLIAMFTSLNIDQQVDSSGSAHWYDYKMKQKSNIETEILVVIDFMLMCGRSLCKTVYDTKAGRLRQSGIDPIFFVVPPYTESLEEADFMTEIMQVSVNQYKRMGAHWNQDPMFVKSIAGPGRYTEQKAIVKNRREGITVPLAEDQIIIWQTHERTSEGWHVHFFSPAKPNEPCRPSQKLVKPYKAPPYTDFFSEIKDKGWYSPRGIPEIVAAFESYLTKVLNESADYMTFVNRPIYTSDGAIANMQNYKLTPGQYVPNGLRKVDQSPPPMSFEMQENKIRQIAEYRVGMPDFGMSDQQNIKEARTAREIDAISALMGQSVDLRVRLFKKSLSQVFQKSWDLLSHYEKDSLEYFQKKEMKTLDAKLLGIDYKIEPTGSVDNMNRGVVMQKAVTRRQMFINVPWINQKELDKTVLEADDPRLVDRLFMDPNEISNDQAEEQADELNNMQLGFPVQLSASDDDFVHLLTTITFVQSRMAKQMILEPQFAGLILSHGQAHQQRLLETPEGRKKVKGIDEGVLGAVIGYLQAMSQAGQPQAPQLPVMPPEGAGAPPMAPGPQNPSNVKPEAMEAIV